MCREDVKLVTCDTWSCCRLFNYCEAGEVLDNKVNEASQQQWENNSLHDSIQAIMERQAETNLTGGELDSCGTTL